MISVHVKIATADLPTVGKPPISTTVRTEVDCLVAETREDFIHLCRQVWDRYEASRAGGRGSS